VSWSVALDSVKTTANMVVTVADVVLDLKHAVIDDFQDLIE
jgi:hypothetical protein